MSKPKHAAPSRGMTRGERATARARDVGDTAKFRFGARQEADKVSDEKDRAAEIKRERREGR